MQFSTPQSTPPDSTAGSGHRSGRSARSVLFGSVLTIAVVAGACSGDSDPTSVGVAAIAETTVAGAAESAETSNGAGGDGDAANNDGDADAGAGDLEAPEDTEDAFDLYNECMADAGYDFGDMAVGDGGEGSVAIIDAENAVDAGAVDSGGSGGVEAFEIDDVDFDGFQDADSTCQGHLANIDVSFDMSPEDEAAFEDAQLEWTSCMRDLGIDVPDIGDASGGLVVVGGAPGEGADLGDGGADGSSGGFEVDDIEAFEAATKECDAVFDELNASFEDLGEGQ